ncbi:MAG TPA: MBL fold metallo-hydrolase [Gemmatimonadetes bacterium]|nr:MBL fold metallo-hydrolase [Gemmatimonadota bacterium]
MNRSLLFAIGLTALGLGISPVKASAQALEIYLIDVEGGGATLFVSPTGQALLVDTGNGGQRAARDAGRIISAMRDAGVNEINHLITTHWHGDHYGAMQELARQVPIRHFIDHGPSVEPNAAVAEFLSTTYRALYQDREHTVVTPGDRITLGRINVRVITAAKQVIERPLRGGGAVNPYCVDFTRQREDNGENAQSVGIIAQFGAFRVLHLGDLTANTEFELMCPRNPIGTVDLFVVTHHGQPSSNTKALVHAIEARAAIMNNGTRKGGQPEAMQVLHSAPGLEDLWQLHFSQLSGQEYTVPGIFIANGVDEELGTMTIAPMTGPRRGLGVSPAPIHNGEAYWLKVSARADGSFTVMNSRNGFNKEYR